MKLCQDGKLLVGLINSFLGSKGEDYCLLHRGDYSRLTADFRAYLTSRSLYTLWSNEALYGHMQSRITYVYDLAHEYKVTKEKFDLTDKDLAQIFGFNTFRSYYNSNKRNQYISAFIGIAKRIAP